MLKTFSAVFVVFFLSFDACDSQLKDESCVIPNQAETGICKTEENCPQYSALIDRLNFSKVENLNFLSAIECTSDAYYEDEDPVICCPQNGDTYNDHKLFIDTENLPKQPLTEIDDYPHESSIELEDRIQVFETGLIPGLATCGRNVKFIKKIINGRVPEIGSFPWVALLLYNTSQPLEHRCGGALITKRYVLTAAHCVTGPGLEKKGGLKAIRLGEFDLEKDRDCIRRENNVSECADPHVDYGYENIIVHDLYNSYSNNKENDIALIRLDKDVKFTNFIKPICLPRKTFQVKTGFFPKFKLSVAGWGETDYFEQKYGRINSPVLMHTKVEFCDREKCKSAYENFNVNIGLGQVCAGGANRHDSCTGDSGGPLMFHNRQKQIWVLSGIVSLGPKRCGSPGIPGIYTKVESYMDWIESNIIE